MELRIGLEFAAVAVSAGLEVTVIDFAERAMQRAISPVMSDYFAKVHRELGVNMHFGEGLESFISDGHRVSAIRGTSGAVYPCDFAVVGLGVSLSSELAESGGIDFDRGIIVDSYLRTNVDHVYAIGDVANFPSPSTDERLRLECVQNAVDMAKTVARTIAGKPTPYDASPWFWSTQGSSRLQIAGLGDAADYVVQKGDQEAGKFSNLLFREGRLVAVESVNSPGHHVASRKLLQQETNIQVEDVEDPTVELKSLVRRSEASMSGAD